MTETTPRWVADKHDDVYRMVHMTPKHGMGAEMICCVSSSDRDGGPDGILARFYGPNCERNAAKAAAVNDLLAACKSLVATEGVGLICTYCGDMHGGDSRCPVYLARAAIAKAEGGAGMTRDDKATIVLRPVKCPECQCAGGKETFETRDFCGLPASHRVWVVCQMCDGEGWVDAKTFGGPSSAWGANA